MMPFPTVRTPRRSVVATAIAVVLAVPVALVGCSSDDDTTPASDNSDNSPGDGSPTMPESGSAIPDVDGALADFPVDLLPRFALDDSGVTPEEIYRRVDYIGGQPGEISWGVEGVADDDDDEGGAEREVRYAGDGSVLEAIDGELIDALPAAPAATLASLYPGVIPEEIERTDSAGTVAFAVLLEIDGAEVEPNFDETGTLLSTEQEIEPSELPAPVATVFEAERDASAANLPVSGFERNTFADGSVEYSVEYENELQSLTLSTTDTGELLVVEHEDALARLSTSETVEDALADYPDNIEADFAVTFPQVTAAEVYRTLDVANGNTVTWGIEGLSDDESQEVAAVYSTDGQFIEQERERILETLPASIATPFAEAYPDAEIDEIAEVEGPDGTSYAVAFTSPDGEELEANYDAAGGFLFLERTLDADTVPDTVLDALGADRVLLPVLGVERVEAADGRVSYSAEYETASEDDDDEGNGGNEGSDDEEDSADEQSISYAFDADGRVLSIEHEGSLPR